MWKEELVRKVFHATDVDQVLQIRISKFTEEDYIAWHYEKDGIFSVKSAYKLAVELQANHTSAGMSNKPAGERDLWNLIWKANVPPKVRVFGWKLATNTLGVQVHRHKRNMDPLPTCNICGMEPETSYHTMVSCTKARALRHYLRREWSLPDEQQLIFTGHDWVLVLLSNIDDSMGAKLLLLW